MSLDDVLKLLFFVTVKLRRATAVALLALAALPKALDMLHDYGYLEALNTPLWLGSVAGCCLLLFVITVVSRGSLGAVITVVWATLFLAGTAAGSVLARLSSREAYNDLGFRHSAEWVVSPTPPGDARVQRLDWQMRAVKDLSSSTLTVELVRSSRCQFIRFWPTNNSKCFTPTVTEVTVDRRVADRWRIRDLRKPADLTFHLDLGAGSQASRDCLPRISIGSTS